MDDRKRNQLFLIVFAAAVFLLSFAHSSNAQPFMYSGQIVAFDNANMTVTVQLGTNEHRTFNVADFAAVIKCGKFVPLNDLKVGDKVTVSYYEAADKKIADLFTLVPGTVNQC